jgi:ZIP family zinc transporter
MFDAIIDFFESIDPILAAFLATTFTWGLTAFGASFVFFFKSMNRVVLDGMLGFTGGFISNILLLLDNRFPLIAEVAVNI